MAGGNIPLTQGQQQFVARLAQSTGLNPGVVAAWTLAEESGGAAQGRQAAGNHDWLNIGYTDSGTFGAGGRQWSNPVAAADATAAWLKGQNAIPGYGRAAAGVQGILRTAGLSPQAQIQAIQHSGWASSGYPDLPALYGQVGGGKLPALPQGRVGTVGSSSAPASGGQGFDQAGYQQAVRASIAGNYLKGAGKSPYDIGPSTGLGSGASQLFGANLLTTKAPDPALYKTAQNSLQALAGDAQLAVHPGAVTKYKGYVNPLHGFTLGRTDMGVDASAQPGTPILALGDSKVIGIRPNWYQGQPYVQMQLLNGPKAGKYWYVAEQISPMVNPGQVVHAGEPIGHYAQQGTGIEIGWGSPGWQTLAQQQGNTGDASHGNSPAGIDFHSFLTAL